MLLVLFVSCTGVTGVHRPLANLPRTGSQVQPSSSQVGPDLEKFMQVIRDKMNAIQEMNNFLGSDKCPEGGHIEVCYPH